ncbi:MAG: Elastase inhibitor AFLEI Flags: Precursor [Comamonadaceae bacterium]|nr:MAG: Elastase inhibitor AFLEI Flags: Precursor [Comamonadaceae bacterium]
MMWRIIPHFHRGALMNWKIITLAALIGLAGCSASNPFSSKSSSAPAASGSTTTAPAASSRGGLVSGNPNDAGECNAGAVQSAVGKPLNQALLDQLRGQAKAGSARTLLPGEMITMEYNPARLNVLVDQKNTVTAVRCG